MDYLDVLLVNEEAKKQERAKATKARNG